LIAALAATGVILISILDGELNPQELYLIYQVVRQLA